MIYTIPSVALFSFFIPVTGISATTVAIGLVLYSLTVLVRNVLAGLDAVPDEVVEAALMGMGPTRMMLGVQLPLALPAIMAGVRIATVSTIALTTVGGIINYGGLGNLIFGGLQTTFRAQVLTASVLCVVLAVAADLLCSAYTHDHALAAGGRTMTPMSAFGDVAAWLTDPEHWHGPAGIPARTWSTSCYPGCRSRSSARWHFPSRSGSGTSARGERSRSTWTNIGRAVPVFAVLVLLAIGPLGLGATATIVALILFGIPPVLTNAYVGMREVDRDTVEAARGMGMTGWQTLRQVELPLALPLILTGIRLAAVQIIATATLGAFVLGGGLGRFINSGFGRQDQAELVGGAVLVAALALTVEGAFELLQRRLDPRRRVARLSGRRV